MPQIVRDVLIRVKVQAPGGISGAGRGAVAPGVIGAAGGIGGGGRVAPGGVDFGKAFGGRGGGGANWSANTVMNRQLTHIASNFGKAERAARGYAQTLGYVGMETLRLVTWSRLVTRLTFGIQEFGPGAVAGAGMGMMAAAGTLPVLGAIGVATGNLKFGLPKSQGGQGAVTGPWMQALTNAGGRGGAMDYLKRQALYAAGAVPAYGIGMAGGAFAGSWIPGIGTAWGGAGGIAVSHYKARQWGQGAVGFGEEVGWLSSEADVAKQENLLAAKRQLLRYQRISAAATRGEELGRRLGERFGRMSEFDARMVMLAGGSSAQQAKAMYGDIQFAEMQLGRTERNLAGATIPEARKKFTGSIYQQRRALTQMGESRFQLITQSMREMEQIAANRLRIEQQIEQSARNRLERTRATQRGAIGKMAAMTPLDMAATLRVNKQFFDTGEVPAGPEDQMLLLGSAATLSPAMQRRLYQGIMARNPEIQAIAKLQGWDIARTMELTKAHRSDQKQEEITQESEKEQREAMERGRDAAQWLNEHRKKLDEEQRALDTSGMEANVRAAIQDAALTQ